MSELLLPVNGFRLMPTACLADGEPSYEAWALMLSQCEHAHRCLGWWLGDLLNYGEEAYGERYVQAVQATGLAVQTLMNYKAVAKAIPPAERVDGLSFSAHREVAFVDKEIRMRLLKSAKKQIEQGQAPSETEIRYEIRQLKGAEPVVFVRLTESEAWALLDDVEQPTLFSARDKIRAVLLKL
jgi:hypothetical protein